PILPFAISTLPRRPRSTLFPYTTLFRSIEKSERLSAMLKQRGIPHQVLNAKYHEKEAEIIAQAGKKGAVTIATNMAGRGTDIILGGNPEFKAREEMRKRGYSDEEKAVAAE